MGMELRRNRQTFPRILLIVRRGLGTPFHYSLSKRGAAFKMPRLSQHSVRCRLNGLPTGPSCSPIPRLAPLRLSNCANSTSRHSRYSSRPFGLRSGPDLSIPNFDPWDGGIDADIPLTRSYRPKAVLSGFISRNNPDETAKNFFELNAEAKVLRKRTVTWNIVPWYIGDGKHVRSANRADLRAGIRELPRLFSLLPRLRSRACWTQGRASAQ